MILCEQDDHKLCMVAKDTVTRNADTLTTDLLVATARVVDPRSYWSRDTLFLSLTLNKVVILISTKFPVWNESNGFMDVVPRQECVSWLRSANLLPDLQSGLLDKHSCFITGTMMIFHYRQSLHGYGSVPQLWVYRPSHCLERWYKWISVDGL